MEAPTILVDMSTISPDTSCTLAEAASEMGITMVDAPVSGSTNAAESAGLVILYGGRRDVFDELAGVFAELLNQSGVSKK